MPKDKQLPKDWQEKTLGEVCNKKSSNISLNKVKNEIGNYPLFKAKGFEKNISYYQQENEYIAIIKDGAGVGRVYRYPAKSSVVATMQYLIPKDNIDIVFLEYFLKKIDFTKYITGATIPHIYFKDYQKEQIFLPPLKTQQHIVKKLDKLFADIDTQIKNTEANIQHTQDLWKSTLNQVFTQNNNWQEKTLGEVYDVRDGTHDSPVFQDNGYPLITSKNLKNSNIVFDKIKFISKNDYDNINKRSKVDAGDILFAMIGTIGNPVVIKEESNFAIKNVALFKVDNSQNSYFLKYYLEFSTTQMIKEAKGTTQSFVSLGYLRKFKISIPSIDKQDQIVQKLDAIHTNTQKLLSNYQNQLKLLEELKQSLLEKAFSGGL